MFPNAEGANKGKYESRSCKPEVAQEKNSILDLTKGLAAVSINVRQ